jgi:hypothetical protein
MAADAKAVLLGGVTRRYPTLRFAFLEGGVGFACNLLADLEGHWEKRHVAALDANLRPTNIEVDRFRDLYEQHASARLRGKIDEVLQTMEFHTPFTSLEALAAREAETIDEFAAVDAHSAAELREQFTRSFYFGCEPDDAMTALAFDHRLATGIRPIFGSDIGHFDVPDMAGVLAEAWELVDRDLITEEDFRRFTYANGVELHTALNPRFFEGTRLERPVAELLGAVTASPEA